MLCKIHIYLTDTIEIRSFCLGTLVDKGTHDWKKVTCPNCIELKTKTLIQSFRKKEHTKAFKRKSREIMAV